MAYDRIEPIGEIRSDYRMAIMATVTATAAGSKTAKPEDFMPRFDGSIKRQPVDDMRKQFERFAKRHNASNAERRRRAGK